MTTRLQRGNERERLLFDAVAKGHSMRAAAGVAGVSERSAWRHLERHQAARSEYELALQRAEAFLVGIVVEAAAEDARHAEWLLSRRWPAAYGDRAQVDLRAEVEGRYDANTLALAARYSRMEPAEIEQEIERLAWVEQPASAAAGAAPGDSGRSTAAQAVAGGEDGTAPVLPADSAGGGGSAAGSGTARSAPSADKMAGAAPASLAAADSARPAAAGPPGAPQPMEPVPPLAYHPPEPPVVCPHCRGAHEADCPIAVEGLRIDPLEWRRVVYGDPR